MLPCRFGRSFLGVCRCKLVCVSPSFVPPRKMVWFSCPYGLCPLRDKRPQKLAVERLSKTKWEESRACEGSSLTTKRAASSATTGPQGTTSRRATFWAKALGGLDDGETPETGWQVGACFLVHRERETYRCLSARQTVWVRPEPERIAGKQELVARRRQRPGVPASGGRGSGVGSRAPNGLLIEGFLFTACDLLGLSITPNLARRMTPLVKRDWLLKLCRPTL